jgi:hypothetical protein
MLPDFLFICSCVVSLGVVARHADGRWETGLCVEIAGGVIEWAPSLLLCA